MKRTKVFVVTIEATGKTNSGIEFLTSCLINACRHLNGFKKAYKVTCEEKVAGMTK